VRGAETGAELAEYWFSWNGYGVERSDERAS